MQVPVSFVGDPTWYELNPNGGLIKRTRQDYLEVPTALLNSAVPFGDPYYPTNGIGDMCGTDSTGNLYIPPPDPLDELLGQCVQRIMPQIKAELSSLNSLWELREINSLLSTARALEASWNRFRIAYQIGYSKWNQLLKDIAAHRRLSSDLYLQYKFNLAPLLGDTNAFYRAFASFLKRAKQRVRDSGRVLTRHTSITLPSHSGDEMSDPTIIWSHDQTIEGRIRRRWEKPPSTFHVEISFSYYYTDFQRKHAAGLSLLDSLGINFNPAIVWNALRWSFALDWVLNISSFLNRLRVSNMEPLIVIHRSLWSHKYSRSIYTSVLPTGQGEFPLMNVRETAYIRQLFTPSSVWISSSGLNSNEWSLIAALAGSRGR